MDVPDFLAAFLLRSGLELLHSLQRPLLRSHADERFIGHAFSQTGGAEILFQNLPLLLFSFLCNQQPGRIGPDINNRTHRKILPQKEIKE